MANRNGWGHCQDCRYFGSPAEVALPNEEARCLHPKLSKYELVVFGASGCNAFRPRQAVSSRVERGRPMAAAH